MMANHGLTVAKPQMLGRIHPQVALSRQNSVQVGIFRCSDKVLRSIIPYVSMHCIDFSLDCSVLADLA
jgi:hypothetical protein